MRHTALSLTRTEPTSLNPDWTPDDDEDQRRKAAIEEMMRSQRERYFRDEAVQQEYRDIVDRQMAAQEAAIAAARGPGPFDEALARFRENKVAAVEHPFPGIDATGLLPLLDNGEGEVRAILRRNNETPDIATETLEPSGTGKADRLPPAKPELPLALAAPNPSRGDGWREDDPSRAFEVDTPFRLDGVERVIETQAKLAKARTGPIQQALKDQLNYAAQKTGLLVEVHEGGQPAKGEVGPREGSTRHDRGGAADLKLFEIVNGQKRVLHATNANDLSRIQDFIRHAVSAGATGVGHGYMGPRAIHIGGGEPLTWGGSPWLSGLYATGQAERQKLLREGAWPNPTKPIPGVAVGPDGPVDGHNRHSDDGMNNDARLLSMMRKMIDTDMILRKIKK